MIQSRRLLRLLFLYFTGTIRKISIWYQFFFYLHYPCWELLAFTKSISILYKSLLLSSHIPIYDYTIRDLEISINCRCCLVGHGLASFVDSTPAPSLLYYFFFLRFISVIKGFLLVMFQRLILLILSCGKDMHMIRKHLDDKYL